MKSYFYKLLLGTVMLTGLMETTHADYSPLKVGNKWVYQGQGSGQPGERQNDFTPKIKFKEALTLEVKKFTIINGVETYHVKEKDSLYDREKIYFPGTPPNSTVLLDTIIERDLIYSLDQRGITLKNGNVYGYGHSDSADIFFFNKNKVPYNNLPINNLNANHKGIQSISNDPNKPYKAWHIDNVGLYWVKVHSFCGQCGCAGSRELLLSTFNGKEIDLGISPLEAVLKKEAKIFCSVLKFKKTAGKFSLLNEKDLSINLLGQRHPISNILW